MKRTLRFSPFGPHRSKYGSAIRRADTPQQAINPTAAPLLFVRPPLPESEFAALSHELATAFHVVQQDDPVI